MLIPLGLDEVYERAERFGGNPPRTEGGAGEPLTVDDGCWFTCRHWDEGTRLCRIYDERPRMCRTYGEPEQPCQHGCGEGCSA